MPVRQLQTNFTTGEITPRLYGRTDIEKYANAVKELTNAHAVAQGGAKRRAGTRFGGATKFGPASTSRLIEFIVSETASYELEFGNLYVRVWLSNGVYSGIELTSPYTSAQVAALDYTQGADTMFLFHGSVAPQRLRSFSPASWDLSAAPFTAQPFDEVGYRPIADLTLGATSGAGVAFSLSAGLLLASDVGRNVEGQTGIGTIATVSSATTGTINITSAFASTFYPSQSWEMDGSPFAFLIPSIDAPVGATATLHAALTRAATLTLNNTTGSITVTASPGIFVSGDSGKVLYADGGFMTLTYVSATQCTGSTTTTFAAQTYGTGSWGITGDAFRSVDVGKYVSLNGGLFQVTSTANATVATATIIAAATSVIAAPPQSWALEDSMWSAAFGWPSTGTLYQQRLWVANTTKYPQTVFGSRTGLYLDFTKGSADSDACIFQVASDTINPIAFLASSRELVILTYGGEFTMTGGNDAPITPTNVQIKPQSTYGCANVRPCTIGKETLFMQRAARKLRALSYSLYVDSDVAPDISQLAEHLTYSGIVDMAYQAEPDGILWLVRADGVLVSVTYDHDQNVISWAKHYTQGAFESVSVIPNGGSDQLWCIVRRTVNGATVRYVEWFDPDFVPIDAAANSGYPPYPDPAIWGCTVDAGVVVDVPLAQATFSGYSHLNGLSIDVIADGCYLGTFPVASGSFTLTRPASRVLAGLHFDTTITLLTPEIQTGQGSAQGSAMRVGELQIRVLNSIGGSLVDREGRVQDLPYRRFGSKVLDQAPQLVTDNLVQEVLGWELGRNEMSIVQNKPLPLHLLSVVRVMTVNG